MASMKVSCSYNVAQRSVAGARPVARPILSGRCLRVRAQASNKAAVKAEVSSKVVAISSAAATLLYSGNALASTEVVGQLAETDGRIAVIGSLFVPVVGWVGFNMLQPLFGQFQKMLDDKENSKQSIATVVGLGAAASMLMADNADAATQVVAQLAESDGRVAVIGSLFVPVVGWVGFNMVQPLFGQFSKMAEENKSLKRSIATAVGAGAGASMLMADNADAATQVVGQLAETDARIAVIASLFLPVVGWVGFNMVQPLFGQFTKMAEDNKNRKRSIATAIGLGAAASMLLADNAEAATQVVGQLAESDGRIAVIGSLFVPVVGWAGFNMLQPLLGQYNKMAEERNLSRK